MADTIEEAIEQVAKDGIASVTVGNQTTTVKSVDELVKADQYLAGKNATAKPHFGLRYTKLVPPGAG